jgi:stress-induced morphogen
MHNQQLLLKILVMLKAPNFIDIDNLSGHHEGKKKSITGQHWSIPMMMMMS